MNNSFSKKNRNFNGLQNLKFLKKALISIALVCVLLTTQTGCSSSITEFFVSDEELHNSPRFWDSTNKVANTSNLYRLNNEFFSGKPFNNLEKLGDKILLVGEARYDDKKKSDPMYSFSLYNPWADTVESSLSAKDINCTAYSVADNNLICFNKKEKIISVYNKKLDLIYRTKYKDLFGKDDPSTFSYKMGKNDSVFFACNNDGFVYELNFSKKIVGGHFLKSFVKNSSSSKLAIKKYQTPFKNATLIGSNKQKNSLYISGVSTSTYTYSFGVFNESTHKITNSYVGSSYFQGDTNDNYILSKFDYSNGYWSMTSTSDGSCKYFHVADCNDASIYDGNKIMLRRDSGYNPDNEKQSISSNFTAYDKDGQLISSINLSFGNSKKGDENYLSHNQIYLKDCNCFFILNYDLKGHPVLYVWKLDNAGQKQNTEPLAFYDNLLDLQNANVSVSGNQITAINDSHSYNWDDLASVRKRANDLEKKYSIKIYLGPEVPNQVDVFSIDQDLDADEVSVALNSLEDILGAYPTNFFKQLCFSDIRGIRIYLSGSIHGKHKGTISSPSGFVNTIDSYLVMVLDASYSWDWSYTVNHEFSHMIDRKLEFRSTFEPNSVYSEKKWNSFNPEGFKYLNSYENYEDNPTYRKNSKYFVDSYGTTYATEDRAEIFGDAVENYLNGNNKSLFKEGSPIREKFKYYCESIRDGFDTTGWPDVTAWEQCIK